MADHAQHDDHHGISHVAPVKVLLGTWGTLMVLTIITVGATKIDLGANYNLALAMAIAVVKALGPKAPRRIGPAGLPMWLLPGVMTVTTSLPRVRAT